MKVKRGKVIKKLVTAKAGNSEHVKCVFSVLLDWDGKWSFLFSFFTLDENRVSCHLISEIINDWLTWILH